MSNLLTKILGDKKEWNVLGLFETSAAQDKRVLEVTGEDVAAFCDERLRGATSYVDTWRASLNRDVASKLAE